MIKDWEGINWSTWLSLRFPASNLDPVKVFYCLHGISMWSSVACKILTPFFITKGLFLFPSWALNCHCLLGRLSDLKLLSSTEIMIACSNINYASNRLTHYLFSLKVGSLYLRFALCRLAYLRWKVCLRIFSNVVCWGIMSSGKTVCKWFRSCWVVAW